MNIRSYLFLFFFLSCVLSAKDNEEFNPETEQQNFENSANYLSDQFIHVFPAYSSRSESFESENSKVTPTSTLTKTFIFENRSGGEYMFSLKVLCNLKTEEFTIEIKDAKVNPISKSLGRIDWNEFNYQMPIYKIALENALMNNAFWGGSNMRIASFADVKSLLQSKIKQLEIIPINNQMNGYEVYNFTYNLKSKDSYFGSLSMSTKVSEDPSEVADLSLTGNYSISLGFKIAKDNQILNGELSIPAISKNSDGLRNLIKTAADAIDFKNQFNDFDTLVKFVKNYFIKFYHEIEIEMIDNDYESQGQLPYKYANLSFENSKMELYLGMSFGDEGVSQYTLMVDYPNNQFSNPVLNVSFFRSSQEVLFQLLSDFGANNIFATIYGDIMGMFSARFEQIRSARTEQEESASFKKLEYYDHTKNMTGDKSKGLTNGDVTCSYRAGKASSYVKVTVEITSIAKDLSFKKTFKMEEYDRNKIWNVMALFFDGLESNMRVLV